MIQKSLRLTAVDETIIKELLSDPRVEKPSDVVFFAYKDSAANIPDWTKVAKKKFLADPSLDESSTGKIISFGIEEQDFREVLNSIKSTLNLQKPKSSFITRQTLKAAFIRHLENGCKNAFKSPDPVLEIKNLDGVSLISRFAQLLTKSDEESIKKINTIKKLLEE